MFVCFVFACFFFSLQVECNNKAWNTLHKVLQDLYCSGQRNRPYIVLTFSFFLIKFQAFLRVWQESLIPEALNDLSPPYTRIETTVCQLHCVLCCGIPAPHSKNICAQAEAHQGLCSQVTYLWEVYCSKNCGFRCTFPHSGNLFVQQGQMSRFKVILRLLQLFVSCMRCLWVLLGTYPAQHYSAASGGDGCRAFPSSLSVWTFWWFI